MGILSAKYNDEKKSHERRHNRLSHQSVTEVLKILTMTETYEKEKPCTFSPGLVNPEWSVFSIL
jgi:hypothetical protein